MSEYYGYNPANWCGMTDEDVRRGRIGFQTGLSDEELRRKEEEEAKQAATAETEKKQTP